MTDIERLIKAARRVSTPIIGIQTVDQASTIEMIRRSIGEAPMITWDVIRGLTAIDQASRAALVAAVPAGMGDSLKALTQSPPEALTIAEQLPAGSAVVMINAHRFTAHEAVSQAIWNLRDVFKADGRTLFLLAPMMDLPSELSQDVIVFDEDLPDDRSLTAISSSLHKASGLDVPANLDDVVSALRGLGAFAAEQCLAMSLTKSGVDMSALWTRKRMQVEQTPGLHFSFGGPTFGDIGGNAQLLRLLTDLAKGPRPPRCIVFVDEIEKSVSASTGGDNSGVSQDQLGAILKGFDELNATGLLLTGPPGTGKSTIAKAAGATFGIPTVTADLGAAKGSLVGQSEQNIRQIFKVIKAIAGDGGALFLATSNRLEDVPPELQRRLGKFGVWMVDLPGADERETIWSICAKRWGIDLPTKDQRPNDHDWTGADIANCCELAYKMALDCRAASEYLAPVAKANPERIKRIRTAAHERFRNSSTSGFYQMPFEETAQVSRSIALP